MKRHHAAAIGALLLLVATVAGTASAHTSGSIEGLVYGIPSPLATEPGEHNINSGVECWADTHKGKVIVLDSNLDVNKQVTDFDSLLGQGAKVLPFVALDPKAFNGPFGRAKAKGATVVELYNQKTTAGGGVYEQSRQAGMDAAKLVGKAYPNGSKALVIGGPPIPAVIERIKGFTSQAKKYKITILQQQDNLKDNVNDARKLADDLLTKHPDAQVVFGFNDNSAIGAGLAAKARGQEADDLRDQRHRAGRQRRQAGSDHGDLRGRPVQDGLPRREARRGAERRPEGAAARRRRHGALGQGERGQVGPVRQALRHDEVGRAPADVMDDAGIQAPVTSEDAAGAAAPARARRLSWGELMTRAPTWTGVGIVLLGDGDLPRRVPQPLFLTNENLTNVLKGASINLLLAVGTTYLLTTGMVDLSIGSMLALCGMILAGQVTHGVPVALAVLGTIAAGALLGGGINGVLVTKAKLSFFVVTLGTLAIFRSAAQIPTSGLSVELYDKPGIGLITRIGDGSILGISLPIAISIGALVLSILVLRYTNFGRSVFAVGGNESASRLAGIPVDRVRIAVFALNGALVGHRGRHPRRPHPVGVAADRRGDRARGDRRGAARRHVLHRRLLLDGRDADRRDVHRHAPERAQPDGRPGALAGRRHRLGADPRRLGRPHPEDS